MRAIVFFAVFAALAVAISAKPFGSTEEPKDPEVPNPSAVNHLISLRQDLSAIMHQFEKDHGIAVHAFNINMELPLSDSMVPSETRVIDNGKKNPTSDMKDKEADAVDIKLRDDGDEDQTASSLVDSDDTLRKKIE